jgi:membrane fusion protein (multidrug efflux system)
MNTKYIYIIGSLALFNLAACGPSGKKNTALPPTPVVTAVAEKQNAVFYDQYPGTVVALNSVQLRTQVAGFITGIYFKDGDLVKKGQPLYEIDRRKFQAAYLQATANLQGAQANYVRAQKDVDRYNKLAQQDAIAKQILDNAVATAATAKSQVTAASAGVLSAKTDLDYSLVKAPFTGRIGISQVKMGAQVSPGTTLLNTISSEDPIAVDFVVDERDIPRFEAMKQKGHMPADSTFRLLLTDGTPYASEGTILAVDRGIDNQSGTIKVRIQFSNAQRKLIDGMSCMLKVLNQKSGIQVVIPYKAITEQMGEFFVFTAQDTIAKQHKVQVGPRVNDKIVITSGINEGDKVITEGLNRLRDGGKITLGQPKAAQGQQAAK